jgi:hypothetical protein
MNRLMFRSLGSVLLFGFLLAPGATANIFSHKNEGPKINYKQKYITKKYNNSKRRNSAAKFGLPKGKHPPTR